MIFFGEILKRPTRADCKSAVFNFAGSNPALPTFNREENQLVEYIVECYGVIYAKKGLKRHLSDV